MTAITAAQVKELRERTGVGMMECKKALALANGDMDLAAEELRKSGQARADKKASRVAAEGIVVIRQDGKRAIILEVNCETDFVARDENFLKFVDAVANTALQTGTTDVSKLATLPMAGDSVTVDEARKNLIAKIGENVNIRRIALTHAGAQSLGTYLHGTRIGVVVELDVD